jgi:tape measure domain-containing protein
MTREELKYRISLEDYFSKGIRDAEGNAVGFEKRIDSIGDHLTRLKQQAVGAFALYKVGGYAMDVVDTTTKFETLNNVINYTSGSTKEAAANHAFLSRIIKDYKLPVLETTEGFSQFSASVLGSALQGEKARKVYEGVSVASTAMHLSAQQSSSVFLALNQMMSKGKVQAQELTLQLGQALPGAMRLASNAMKMTTAQFMKEMEKGNIASADFLPKFADELSRQFSGAIPNAIQSLQARRTEMENQFVGLKLDLGEAFFPMIEKAVQYAKSFAESMKEVAKWAGQHYEQLRSIAIAITATWTAYKVFSGAVAIYKAITIAIEAAGSAQLAFNAAIMASPIGLVAAGIGVITYALDQYVQGLNDFTAANNSTILNNADKSAIWQQELDYMHSKTEELKKQKGLTEEVAIAQAKSQLQDKLMSDYSDAKKKYDTAFFNEDMETYGKQGKIINTISEKLKNLKDSRFMSLINGLSSTANTANAPVDLGSGISEPKASRIQNVNIAFNGEIMNRWVNHYASGPEGSVKDFMDQLAEAFNGIVTNVSLIAHE